MILDASRLVGRNSWSEELIPTPEDPFDEWMRLPVDAEPDDARFEVRRAHPDEFDRLYDLVDAAFGRTRSRPLYEWLYRGNPFGRARSWIVVERASGEILKAGTNFPWPIWRGQEPIRGVLAGDHVTAPEWQRKGLTAVRRQVSRNHPWWGEDCSIAGPNKSSRIVERKAGNADDLAGALRGGLVVLDAAATLASFGISRFVAKPAGLVAKPFLSTWQRRASRGAAGAGGRVEEIGRFSVDFDDVTERCMAYPKFWCPHNAAFLNWRYLDHPEERYVGLALVEDERPTGYAVVRLAGEGAMLSEFAVEPSPSPHAFKLLDEVFAMVRKAGCAYLNFFAPPGWRHWGLFHRTGFIPYRSKNHVDLSGKQYEPEVQDLRNWQLMPGDRDYH